MEMGSFGHLHEEQSDTYTRIYTVVSPFSVVPLDAVYFALRVSYRGYPQTQRIPAGQSPPKKVWSKREDKRKKVAHREIDSQML